MRAVAFLLVLTLVAGCSSPADPDAPAAAVTPGGGSQVSGSVDVVAPTAAAPAGAKPLPKLGIAVSPRSFEGEDFSHFFVEADDLSDLLLWGGDAGVLADTQGAADVIATLARQRSMRYGVQVGFHAPGKAFDEAARSKATLDVVAFADRVEPDMLVLGVEVDRIYRTDPAWVTAFAAWYNDVYDDVKRVAPNTLVFPSFQLENTKGWTGGLFGGAEKSEELWHVVAMFEHRDLNAFTTYPCYLYKSPNAIPADYYTSIRDHVEGPIAFTEVGWYAANLYEEQGWGSSAEEQALFAERFLAEADAIDAATSIWLHLHDQPSVSPEPAQSMGLVDASGVKRAAYDVWYGASHA